MEFIATACAEGCWEGWKYKSARKAIRKVIGNKAYQGHETERCSYISLQKFLSRRAQSCRLTMVAWQDCPVRLFLCAFATSASQREYVGRRDLQSAPTVSFLLSFLSSCWDPLSFGLPLQQVTFPTVNTPTSSTSFTGIPGYWVILETNHD